MAEFIPLSNNLLLKGVDPANSLIKHGGMNMEKYIKMAKDGKAEHALILSPDDIVFDRRVILKCLWGCENQFDSNRIKCGSRGLSFEDAQALVRTYQRILLIHHHDDVKMSRLARKIEQAAFLDGHYFASAMNYCHLCKNCRIDSGKPCHMPLKIRPCDQSFGIDVYKTVRLKGLPCNPLQSKTETPNRYAFVMID